MSKTSIHLPASDFTMCEEAFYLMLVKPFEAQNCHVSINIIDGRNISSDGYYFFSLKMSSNLD